MTLIDTLQITLSILLVSVANIWFLHVAVLTVSSWRVTRYFVWLRSCFWILLNQHSCLLRYGFHSCNDLLIVLVLPNATCLPAGYATNLSWLNLLRIVGDGWVLIRNLLKNAGNRALSGVVLLFFLLLNFAVGWRTLRLRIKVRM
jgi:hypothetical protein